MTQEGWFDLVRDANWAYEYDADRSRLDLLAQLLAEQDAAKSRLQQMGVGCIGMPWANVVDEIQRRFRAVKSIPSPPSPFPPNREIRDGDRR